MRKTKIICTLGPATDKEGIMEALIREGMDVARFNFSHGTHEEQKKRLEKLKTLRIQFDRPIAALLDTKGPEIRLGCFKDHKISLEEGQKFTLVNDETEGTQEQVTISYKNLYKDVKPGFKTHCSVTAKHRYHSGNGSANFSSFQYYYPYCQNAVG